MTALLLFIGTTELLLIAGIALLLFGGKKLPEMMRGLGQGMQSFKKGMNEDIPGLDIDAADSPDTETEQKVTLQDGETETETES